MALKPFNSIGGFSVGEVASNVILANGDITTTNITTTGISNLNSIGNVRVSGGSAGQVITTNGSGVLSFSTIDTSIISNGTSNVSVASNGNVTAAVAGNTIFTVTTAGANLVGNLTAGGIKTDNIYYANGTPWDMQQPSGANNQIQFNDNGSFGASANFTFDAANTTLAVGGDDNANILVGNSAFGTTILGGTITVGDLVGADQVFIRKDVVSVSGNASTGNAFVSLDVDSGVGYTNDNIYTTLSSTGLYIDNTTPGSNAVVTIQANGAISATNSNDTYFAANGNALMWLTVDNAGFEANANVATHTSKFQAPQLISNVATGTAPFVVTSTTQVANLNVATAGTAGSATTAGTVTTAAQPNITSVGNLTGLTVGNATSNVVIADNGTVTSTGNITAPYFIGNVQGNISGNIVVPGSNGEVIFNNAGNAGASNAFSFNTSSNVLTVSGNVSATNFIGNGAALTAITGGNVTGQVGNALVAGTVYTNAQPNITSVGTLTSLTVTGNIGAGNVSATDISGTTLGGTLTTAAQPNVTSVGTLTDLTVTGNITTSANLVTDLIVGRTTSVSIEATGTNSNVFLKPTGTGTVDVWGKVISNVATPLASFDAATKQYVDDVAQGLHIHASAEAATPDTLATISSGTVTYNNGTAGVGATLTTTGTYTTIDGVTLSNGMRILVKDEANLAHNGIYVRTSSTVLTRADDFDTAAEIQGGDFTFVTGGTLYNSTGWVQIDDVTTVGTDPIDWVQFSGAGTYLAGTGLTLTGDTFSISNTAVTSGSYGDGDSVASFTVNAQGQLTAAGNVVITANAANLSGTTLSSTVVNSSLTSVGTLGSLAVTGAVTAGNVYANSGTIGASSLAGTLTTAAQPNVTSVGTLTSLTVTGNVAAGNVSGTTGAFTNVSGNGSALTAITGANVTGQVANALVAGTVYTNAQPNITSVGTLTSLAVTGNVTTGNISGTNGNLTTANVSGNIIIGGTTVSAGTVTTTATTPNATIASFPVSGTTGIEFLVKGVDSSGKYSVAKVVAVTDGTDVDYTVFATVNIGTNTGTGLQVVVDTGNVKLQVTPTSSNSTVWTTQYNLV